MKLIGSYFENQLIQACLIAKIQSNNFLMRAVCDLLDPVSTTYILNVLHILLNMKFITRSYEITSGIPLKAYNHTHILKNNISIIFRSANMYYQFLHVS